MILVVPFHLKLCTLLYLSAFLQISVLKISVRKFYLQMWTAWFYLALSEAHSFGWLNWTWRGGRGNRKIQELQNCYEAVMLYTVEYHEEPCYLWATAIPFVYFGSWWMYKWYWLKLWVTKNWNWNREYRL